MRRVVPSIADSACGRGASRAHAVRFAVRWGATVVLAAGLWSASAFAADPGAELRAGNYVEAYRQSAAVDTAASQLLAARAAANEAVYGHEGPAGQRSWLRRARTSAERATVLAPTDAEAYVQLARAKGELARRAGLFESAGVVGQLKSLFDHALKLDPDNADALVGLAMWNLELTQRGVGWLYGADRSKVLPLLRKGVAAAPRQVNLRVEYATALRALGHASAAQVQLRAALRLPATSAVDQAEQARARALLSGGS